MGKISNVAVVFDSRTDVFKPGEPVSGQVAIGVERSVKVLAVRAQLRGWCSTKWKLGAGDDAKYYREEEEYCRQEILMWGSNSEVESQLLIGTQRKAFLFNLPPTCPSSFHSKHGTVNYMVTVTCKPCGLMSSVTKMERYFTVRDPVDLTEDPAQVQELCRPLELRGEPTYISCFLIDRTCTFQLATDKRAYVPGERIVLSGFIHNECPKKLRYCLTLKQRVTYHGRRHGFSWTSSRNLKSTQKTESLCTWQGVPVSARTRQPFTNLPTLLVPELVPTPLRNCRFIDVAYLLEMSCQVPGTCGSRTFRLPEVDIVIGSRIPDRPRQASTTTAQPSSPPPDDDPPPAFADLHPSAPPAELFVQIQLHDDETDDVISGADEYPDELPPSYQDCIDHKL